MLAYIILLYVLGIERTFLGNLKLIKYLILTPMLLSAFIIDYKLQIIKGIDKTIIANLDLIKYMIIAPALIIVFVIDYKQQIIPNRLNMTMFEIGIIFMFLAGVFNSNIAIDMFLGMVAGAGIFLIITLLGGAIAGKEAMGFGDVKLMGALGIYFGLANIIVITLAAFLIGAILSILLLVTKIKKTSEYIPFGPFIVIAAFITMVIPFNTILAVLLYILSLGMIKI